MKLYAIVTDGVDGPEPLYDSETGAPTVYADEVACIKDVSLWNTQTPCMRKGGYDYIEFETED